MALTKPLPEDAMPVIKVIRRDIPRPDWKKFHGNDSGGTALRIRFNHPNPKIGLRICCPMGMHEKASNNCPQTDVEFLGDAWKEVMGWGTVGTFYRWWDEQKDPEAAVQAVWG